MDYFLLTAFVGFYIAGTIADSSLELSDCDRVAKGSICYNVRMGRFTWEEAASECRFRYGGRLASPTDQEEHDVILELVMSSSLEDESVWLGGALTDDFDWRWVDPIPTGPSYVRYQGCYSLSPDNMTEVTRRPSMTVRECTTLCTNYTYSGVHYDDMVVCSCGDMYNVNQPRDDDECPDPACMRNTSPECGSPDAQTIYRVPLGAVTPSLNDTRPFWSRRGAHDRLSSCALLSSSDDHRVMKTACILTASHICQHNLSRETCQENSGTDKQWVSGRCLSLHSESLSWHAARAHCRSHSGDLVAIDSADIHRAVVDTWLSGLGEDWWIGLTNRVWTWDSTGEDIGYNGFENWKLTEPRYQYALETEGCIIAAPPNFYWEPLYCGWEGHVVCESGPHIVPDDETFAPTSNPEGGAGNSGNKTPRPTEKTTRSPDESADGDDDDNGLIIGAAVGALVAVVVIIVIGLLIIYILRKRHKKALLEKEKDTQMTPHPVYTTSLGLNIDNRGSTYSHHVYEELPDHLLDPGYERLGQERTANGPYSVLERNNQQSVRSGVYSELDDTQVTHENSVYQAMDGSDKESDSVEPSTAENGDNLDSLEDYVNPTCVCEDSQPQDDKDNGKTTNGTPPMINNGPDCATTCIEADGSQRSQQDDNPEETNTSTNQGNVYLVLEGPDSEQRTECSKL